jgi:hypothetical protein
MDLLLEALRPEPASSGKQQKLGDHPRSETVELRLLKVERIAGGDQ